jgi:small subunit ribosomal protein S1
VKDAYSVSSMTESFAKLFEESLSSVQLRTGSVVRGIVVDVGSDYVIVNANLKSEGVIPVEQFYNESGACEVVVGDEVDVVVEAIEDGYGETRLSREKAKRAEAWTALYRAHDSGTTIRGLVTGKVKGGFTVELGTIRAFLPGSLVDVRPVRDTSYIEGKDLEFKVIKLDQKRNNIVLSRRAVIEAEGSAEREALLGNLQEGQMVKGIVKNLTDYGAFVDLGGVDGLLHVTDMSWKRVKHPSEVVTIGDEVNVVVLKFDRERGRVSLGLKQLGDDPWTDLVRRYPVGARLFGKVTNVTDYGCFVEIENGVEGLVHVSEMDWTNKNISPNKIVQVGTEVEVMVLDVDTERRRISLGIKQCQANPWEAFAATHSKGEQVTGKIKSITDFGLFIGLDGGIDGLIHLSDISWSATGEEAVRNYKKGDEITAVILSIDPERERISLGIKQLEGDPQSNFLTTNPKGSLVKGVVKEVDAKGAKVELADGIEGYLKAADLSFNVGDEVEMQVTGLDRKGKIVNLSLKTEESATE